LLAAHTSARRPLIPKSIASSFSKLPASIVAQSRRSLPLDLFGSIPALAWSRAASGHISSGEENERDAKSTADVGIEIEP
jgi:hypothetical protein